MRRSLADPGAGPGPERRARRALIPGLMSGLAVLGLAMLGLTVTPRQAAAATVLEPRLGLAECDGGNMKRVPGCFSLTTKNQYNVLPGRQRNIRFTCRGNTPYFWNWHADLSRGMQVTLRSIIKSRTGQDSGAMFELREQGGVSSGAARIYLGCSATKPQVVSRLQSIGLDPVSRN